VSNLKIANFFLFVTILLMALCAKEGLVLYFIYAMAATAMAGAVRWYQLPHEPHPQKRR
jgi:hypothetical protein